MKQTLLYALFVVSFVSAQTLQSEDFNALTVGNIASSTAAGQGGWYLDTSNGTSSTSTNAGFTNAQIVLAGGSNALQVVGPNGDKGSRFIWKNGLNLAWSSRTIGNNIIEVEVDINRGSNSVSQNTMGINIYDSTYGKVLAGFSINASTGELALVAYSTPTGQPVDNYIYSLANAPGIIIPANQISRIGISFNKTTGQIRIKAPGISATGMILTGSASGTDPFEVDVFAFAGGTITSANSAAATMLFDNITVKATATDMLLSSDSLEHSTSTVSLYPNPTSSILNINTTNNAAVKNMQLVDVNGRVIKTTNGFASQLDLAELSNGVYMLTIETTTAKETKKIIKN